MEWEKEIKTYLYKLTAIPSISGTEGEKQAAAYLGDVLCGHPYFRKHPEHSGMFKLQGDWQGRSSVFGLVRGREGSRRTLILMGHYDVVDTKEYGSFEYLAWDPEGWERLEEAERERLRGMLSPEAREDFDSGEWIFGRGVSDMKGGLAAGLAVLDWYGRLCLEKKTEEEAFEGNLLFLAVPDEEAYSAGMRGSLPLLEELKKRYGLDYEGLIDLEPCLEREGKLPIHIGSVGKCMPVILAQGVRAHVLEPFRGMNAAGLMAELMLRTELSPEFAQQFQGEICPPPTWLNLRDRKESYDVSVPLRASGYMNLLYFSGEIGTLQERLREVGEQAFAEYYERMKACREQAGIGGPMVPASWEVMTVQELRARCRRGGNAEAFDRWYGERCEEICRQVQEESLSWPQATAELMDQLLSWSGITSPVFLLGFAPPFYPAFHSDRLPGREGEGSVLAGRLLAAAREVCGERVEWEMRHYFCGISDLSYCGALEEKTLEAYSSNAPMWGRMYQIDCLTGGGPCIPSLLFGPEGRDIHQMGERVRAISLFSETPRILQKLIEQMFANRAGL